MGDLRCHSVIREDVEVLYGSATLMLRETADSCVVFGYLEQMIPTNNRREPQQQQQQQQPQQQQPPPQPQTPQQQQQPPSCQQSQQQSPQSQQHSQLDVAEASRTPEHVRHEDGECCLAVPAVYLGILGYVTIVFVALIFPAPVSPSLPTIDSHNT
nr:alpha/beta-gliadin A-IV-like [Penaeus vannamei]